MIRLRVSRSDTESHDQEFTDPVITIGRDPTSVLRFDMDADRQVSTRHAEIRFDGQHYVIADRDSTNGTWVNASRVREPRRLNAGDVINLGSRGPELRVLAVGEVEWRQTQRAIHALPPIVENLPKPRESDTRSYILAVERKTRRFVASVSATLLVVLLGGLAFVSTRSQAATDDPDVWREVTMPSIRRANDEALALLDVRIPGSPCAKGCEGTGFAVGDAGQLVTNRHVVRQGGRTASEVFVKFSGGAAWRRARVVRVAENPAVDLALLQLEGEGPFPSVAGLSDRGADLPVGSAVLVIGFPLGSALRMDGVGDSARPVTTLTTGAVSKILRDVIQIDATATHGSSGSPVFDRHGHVIGAVSAGARSDEQRIVYVVPATEITKLLRGAEGQR